MRQKLGTEIELTMIPVGLQVQLAFSEGYWCIGTPADAYINRKRCGRVDIQKALSQVLQKVYGIGFNDFDKNAIYTLILSHRDLCPVSVNQVFFVKREYEKQPAEYTREDTCLPRLQKFRIKGSVTRQPSGDRDVQAIWDIVNTHKQLAFSYALPIAHI